MGIYKSTNEMLISSINEASKALPKNLEVNEFKLRKLKEHAALIEDMAKENNSQFIEVNIDEVSQAINVRFEACFFETGESEAYPFPLDQYLEVAKASTSFGFQYISDDSVFVTFTFPSVWDKRSWIKE